MIKTLLVAAVASGSGFVGWIGGSIWPAPPEWTDVVNRSATDVRARLRLSEVNFTGLRALVPTETLDRISNDIRDVAMAAGEMIMVERDSGTLEEQLDNLALSEEQALPSGMIIAAAPPPPPVAPTLPAPDGVAPADTPPASSAPAPEAAVTPPLAPPSAPLPSAPLPDVLQSEVFPARLELCPRMDVTNAPASRSGVVTGYAPIVLVNDRPIATFPSPGACLSSGFGPRNDRLHKGLDFHADTGVTILAAGDGEIIELKYRDDYGNMIVIDHGGGVFTRYAHLASFGRGLSPGVTVRAGEAIGLMGNSASYRIPIHLHYELLLGEIQNPKGSFGLEPADPLDFPAAE